ncbi:MAG: class I SAM-dependent methyltransferase [Clostridiales bacterium]|nr:class I SAM-dependent methyltransferase [Clostridiales bacterium]
MFISDKWKDFEVLDAGGGHKLERWGETLLRRPDPQAVWPMGSGQLTGDRGQCDAEYVRSKTGGGAWTFHKTLPQSWTVRYGDLTFVVRPTGFKHTGLFPEQASNWNWMRARIAAESSPLSAAPTSPLGEGGRPVRVLNLFGYTGGATCACAKEGAHVTHVDAAKGMVAWAKENAAACGLRDAPIRYIVDDCLKFVRREGRRGNRYDAILMDPPSYGRGPTGEMWKMEDSLYELVEACAALLSDRPVFFLINSYTTGLAPSVLANVLRLALPPGQVEADEVGLPITRGGLVLPCGASGRWVPSNKE